MTQPVLVHVKLGGAMVQYAPEDQTASQFSMNLQANTSVLVLLHQLQVPDTQPVMIILNDAMVARPDYATTLLSDGDAVALMPPIQAG